jgi:hypothetical protein
MAKGFFTQSICLLLERPIPLDDVTSALRDCTVRGSVQFREQDAEGRPLEGPVNWAGADVLVVNLSADARGALLVDVVPAPWPDAFATPEEDARLYGALTTGQFGPYVFPEALERAMAMGRAADRGIGDVAEGHHAFLRLRATWAIDAAGEGRAVPPDYDPVAELRFMTEVAAHLLELPGALAYFNPNGEVLASLEELEESLDRADEQSFPPLDLWANLRFIQLADLEGWALVDTIGMMQLDAPDHEALFRKDRYDPREIAMFLRHASWSALERGRPFEDGVVAMGPGKRRWKGLVERIAIVPMPRPVVRWIPLDGSEDDLPPELLEKPRFEEEPPSGG